MARRSFDVGSEHFPTKAALLGRCRALLKSSPPFSPTDDTFLAALLERHRERDQKIGCGVARFFIAPDGYGGRCFWLERIDGSRTDWSFLACIDPPTHEAEVRAALRRAVRPQIIAFLDNAYREHSHVPCAITGSPVARHGAHVDHEPPATFLALVEQFFDVLRQSAIDPAAIAVKPTEDGSTETELADAGIRLAWVVFHGKMARLRVTTARANLSQGSGGC